MNEQATFIRWGIPGWTAAITFVIFVFSDYLSVNDDRMFLLLNQAFAIAGIWQAILAGLLVAGAGVPLGFIIYQIYFYLRWNSPISRDGLFPPSIVGRWADIKDSVRDLDDSALELGQSWRHSLNSVKDHRASWHYLSALIYDAILHADSGSIVYSRYNYLKDLVHTLGASHLGLTLGFWGYLIVKWKIGQAGLGWPLMSIAVMFILLMLVSKEDGRNKKPLKLFRMRLEYPAELFLASLIFIFLSLNPALNAIIPFFLPSVMWIGVFLLWGWSVRHSREIIWGWALVLAGIVYVLNVSPWLSVITSWVNWPVVLSTLIFGCISLAFFKNRQNTREDLATMEHYYLQEFINNQRQTQDESLLVANRSASVAPIPISQ